MDREEYRQFMEQVYQRYVVSRSPRRIHPFELHEIWTHEWTRIRRATMILRTIEITSDDEQDIYGTYRTESLSQIVSTVESAVRRAESFGEDSGVLEALDDFHHEIIDDMSVEDLPPEELEVMRQLGATDPRAELLFMMSIINHAKTICSRGIRSNGLRTELVTS